MPNGGNMIRIIRYGIDDETIHRFISDEGFLPFRYHPFPRGLTNLSTYNRNSNTIYARDVTFVKEHIQHQRNIILPKKR